MTALRLHAYPHAAHAKKNSRPSQLGEAKSLGKLRVRFRPASAPNGSQHDNYRHEEEHQRDCAGGPSKSTELPIPDPSSRPCVGDD